MLPSLLIDNCLLFDCGEGMLQRLQSLHISLDQIKAIFLTHFHADHLLGLFSFLYKDAFYSNRENSSGKRRERTSPPIFVPEGMQSRLMDIVHATNSTFEGAGYHLDLHELPIPPSDFTLSQPRSINIGDTVYQFEWAQTDHVPLCYAYKISDTHHSVLYTGDTGPATPGLRKLCQSVSLLIHESSFSAQDAELARRLHHSTPATALELAIEAHIPHLVLTHVPDLTSEDEETTFLSSIQESARAAGVCMEIAHDLAFFTLDG